MALTLWSISKISFKDKKKREKQSFSSADTGTTEVNTTDIMLELYSILLMVINAPLLGDRQCQLPVRVVPLGGCAWASARGAKGHEEGSSLLPT